MEIESIKFRTEVKREDIENVNEILFSSGFFYDFEIAVAVELVEDALENGTESDYLFVFAEYEGNTVGYTCFGKIACTKHSYDLYWIGVHNNFRGAGIGKILMTETEKIIKKIGGKGVYIETSSKEKYIPTQKFYDTLNCELIARIKDFYDEGDDKLIYKKIVL